MKSTDKKIDKDLGIHRYDDGKLAKIGRVVFLTNLYDSVEDTRTSPTSYICGPFVSFYQNGKVKSIGVDGFPTSHSLYYSDLTIIYDYNPIWSKDFDEKGRLVETYGQQGEFKPDVDMLEILKKENLLGEVEKALLIQKKTKLTSLLSESTTIQTPKKIINKKSPSKKKITKKQNTHA